MAESTSNLSVSGGAGGIGANLDDMQTESGALFGVTGSLLDSGRHSAGVAFDSNLLESALLSPVTAAEAERRVAAATGLLVVSATEAGASALYLGSAVNAYRAADASLAALQSAAANTATFVVGALAIPLAAAAIPLALADGVGIVGSGLGAELVDSIKSGKPFSIDDAEKLMKTMLGQQLSQLESVLLQPQVLDIIGEGVPGLLNGLTMPLIVALGPVNADLLLTQLTGTVWPPTDYDQALRALIGGGSTFGLLVDGRPITEGDIDLGLPDLVGTPIAPPTDIQGLLDNSADIDNQDSLLGQPDAFARIRITEVPGDPPHYIVQIPSTQNWSPTAGSTPNDLTADVHAMAGQQTALSNAVVAAMQRAGIRSTDPVMLEGFSLGGITAGQMAADPSVHYNITNVVTAGSPIADFDIPSSVKVLSLEFDEDPVAQLDGHQNPDDANWTTVKEPAPTIPSDLTAKPGSTSPHNADRYAVLGAQLDQSSDPSVVAWKDSASGFFSSDSSYTDYGAQRP